MTGRSDLLNGIKVLLKRISFVLVSVSTSVCFLQAQVSINDFRIPQSKSTNMFLNLNGSISRNTYSSQDRYAVTQSLSSYDSKSGYAFLNGDMRYYLLEFNDDFSNELRVGTSGGYSYNSRESTRRDPDLTSSRSHSSSESFSFSPNWAFSYYLIPDQFYTFGRFDGLARYSFSDNEEEPRSGLPYTSRSREYVVTAGAGIGVGKVRDGQVVFRVLRLLEKLQEDGALSRDLDRNEVMEIVDVFARNSEYTANHERFTKYFFKDIFAILDSVGVLSHGHVVPYDVVRSEEILSERVLPRIFGWRGQVGVEHSSSQYEYTGSYSDYSKSAFDHAVSLVEYGYSISLNTHFHTIGLVRIPLNGEPRRSDIHGAASISYEVGERIEATLEWSYNAYSASPRFVWSGTYRQIDRMLVLDSNYFIEDHVALNINGGYRNQDWYRFNAFSDSESSQSESSLFLTFGLKYRIF